MKRNLLIVLLLAAASMASAAVLPLDSVRVTYYSSDYYSEDGWYNYFFEFSNKAEEFPMLEFSIFQETNTDLARGHYSLEDENMVNVTLLRNLTDAIAIELGGYTWQAMSAALTVSKEQDGAYTLSLTIEDNEGETYTATLTTPIEVQESHKHPYNDPYLIENREPQTFDMVLDQMIWDDSQFYTQSTMKFNLYSSSRDKDGLYYRCVLWVNTASQIPPAGTYPILGTGAIGTVDASYGYDSINNIVYPSYFGLSDDRGLLYDPELYFLVDGNVVISYPTETTIRIEVDAFSWWKSHIHLVYEDELTYAPAETATYDIVLDASTDIKNIGYLGAHEYSLQVMGSDAASMRYKLTLDLMPGMENITGRFCNADGTFNPAKSAVQTSAATYHVADGDILIASNGDDTYTLSGWVRDERGNRYNLSGDALEIEFINSELYRYEMENPAAHRQEHVFDNIIWNQEHVEDSQYLEIVLVSSQPNADGTKSEAVLWMTTPTAVFDAGTFPINSTEENFTFFASPGNIDGLYPCLYYTVNNKGIQEVWFLTGGTVTIDYPTATTVSVEVHALSYFGSAINLYYNVEGMAVPTVVETPASCSKRLVHGELLLLTPDATYDILGRKH